MPMSRRGWHRSTEIFRSASACSTSCCSRSPSPSGAVFGVRQPATRSSPSTTPSPGSRIACCSSRAPRDAVAGARQRKIGTVIAIIDLDRFKVVNDTLGHVNGDEVLTVIANDCSLEMRPGETVARLGGDEFGVIISGGRCRRRPALIFERSSGRRSSSPDLPIAVEASVGYAEAPEHGLDPVELMQRADVAMYLAKGNHAGVMRYDPHRTTTTPRISLSG